MAIEEFEINADNVLVTSGDYNTAVLKSVVNAQLLDGFSVEEIVDHCGAEALLDAIGKEAVLRHFDIDLEPNGWA